MGDLILAGSVKTFTDKLISETWEGISSIADLDSKIKELQDKKSSIEATLLDAESSDQHSSHSVRDVLDKLETALTKLINFQEAKASKAKQKQLMGGNKIVKEMRLFFSATSNQIVSRFIDARKIKAIEGEMSLVAKNHVEFGTIFSHPSCVDRTLRSMSVETGSHLTTDIVVGRYGDRSVVVNRLFDDQCSRERLCVASIFGIGGMGKTTLAQYIYNDPNVTKKFDARYWVFVNQNFNVKDVLGKILASGIDEKPVSCVMDQLQNRLNREICGKKVLLVLDNMWDQDLLMSKWLELRTLLEAAEIGSKVIVTTRSETVARIMSTVEPYELHDLSENDCWVLFQRIAFTKWQEPGVVALGEEIAKMCRNVPLVIRSIAGLLAAKHTVAEWQDFRNDQLANFASYGRSIVHTLKLSYDQLETRLKLCVAYCSLFPKGFNFGDINLKHMWIALQYVKPQYKNQSQKDAAVDYINQLIYQGFFQFGERGLRMHDLMHDLVLSVAGYKYEMVDAKTVELDERVHHLSIFVRSNSTSWIVPPTLFKIKQLESFILEPSHGFKVRIFTKSDKFLSKQEFLRVLDLHKLGIMELPKYVGQLLHLRYLDLSYNPLCNLPNTITKLDYLYFLDLSGCDRLQELPKDIGRLTSLRHLNLLRCNSLIYMPEGFKKLIDLQTIGHFVVGQGSKGSLSCGLAGLNEFDNLEGWLVIHIKNRIGDMVQEAKDADLRKKHKIEGLEIRFNDCRTEDEMVLEYLQPNANLRELHIDIYGGERFPSWMRQSIHHHLPNLTMVYLRNCKACKYISSFGWLRHLRTLEFRDLDVVEYIEQCCASTSGETTGMDMLASEDHSIPLFPSLEYLCLDNVPNLKGWWSCEGVSEQSQSSIQSNAQNQMPGFPRLYELSVNNIEMVTLLASGVLRGVTSLNKLTISSARNQVTEEDELSPAIDVQEPIQSILLHNYLPNLNRITFRDLKDLKNVPDEFQGMSLKTLDISNCVALEGLPEWIDTLTSLTRLHIYKCPKLESLPNQMKNLTSLQSLTITGCSEQLLERCSEPAGEYWPNICHIPKISIRKASTDY